MLSAEEKCKFEQDGYLLLPELFGAAEVATLRAELPTVFGEPGEHRTLEAGAGAVRGVHGVHRTNRIFGALIALPRLVEPARQLLGGEVYVHQFKINAKLALVGDVWEWHQDYRFWRDEDGMPSDRAINAAIFMDEVNEFNGPLMLVPGSHRDQTYDTAIQMDAEWSQTLAAKLKYSLSADTLARATQERGIVAPKGPAGCVLLFHSNILHCSAPNMSPNNRTLALISYNSVTNQLAEVAHPRPEFLASRSFEPVHTVADDALLALAGRKASAR